MPRFLSLALTATLVAHCLAEHDPLQGALDFEDACSAEDGTSEECSLELRQLRAKQAASEIQNHQHEAAAVEIAAEALKASELASFGELMDGTNMWQGQTWTEVLAEIHANITAQGGCKSDTGGTCRIRSCKEWRGPTRCTNHECQCETGYCALMGQCFPVDDSHCTENTGGTCTVFSCSGSRGLTKCKAGQCICKTGGCAYNGQCYPVTYTGGSCKITGCASSRGPTTCHRGRCLCQDGYVAVKGVCQRVA